ncbi:MAG: CPBP family intramembrane glutamic endopeptidase [Micropruina sp.]
MSDTLTGSRRTAATVVMVTVAFAGAGLAVRWFAGGEPAARAVGVAVLLAVTAVLLWLGLRATGTPVSALGLDAPRGAARAAAGALAGLGVVLAGAALVLIPAAVAGVGNAGWPPSATLLTILLVVAGSVLPEEALFRGFVQYALGTRLRGSAVVLAQAALFAGTLAVVQGNLVLLGEAFLLGVLLGFVRQRSSGLWTVIGARTGLVVAGMLTAGMGLPPAWAVASTLATSVAALVLVVRRPRRKSVRAGADLAPLPRRSLEQRGVLYDVGSSYLPGQHSRERWRPEVVADELRVIADELHCTAVTIFGEDLGLLEEAARLALDRGLFVWLQPRLVDGSQDEIVERLARVAAFGERLRAERPGRVGLNVGCELTVFARGIIPGRTFGWRLVVLAAGFLFGPVFDRRLNRLLARLVGTARPLFGGPLTYGSGTWEGVDWAPFDLFEVDYRSTPRPTRTSAAACGRCVSLGKAGADHRVRLLLVPGCAGAWRQRRRHPRLARPGRSPGQTGYQRDEQVQADVIEELLDIYETEDLHGAFVCMFIEGDCRYSDDPDRDQDKASYGIVRPPTWNRDCPPTTGTGSEGGLTPSRAVSTPPVPTAGRPERPERPRRRRPGQLSEPSGFTRNTSTFTSRLEFDASV